MKTIAIFDFDGTITRKDTFIDFIRFSLGFPRLLQGLLLLSPVLISYKLKIISNQTAKELLFYYFFKGMQIRKYQNICELFSARINEIINRNAMDKILWHKKQNHTVLCISASIEDWIIPWAEKNYIDHVIATKAEKNNGSITGRFLSKNCFGPEKVNRFLEAYPERNKYLLYVYGDSRGDMELLDIADYKFYRCF